LVHVCISLKVAGVHMLKNRLIPDKLYNTDDDDDDDDDDYDEILILCLSL
jgi:hypothetical protein